jgi:hypothetical protein
MVSMFYRSTLLMSRRFISLMIIAVICGGSAFALFEFFGPQLPNPISIFRSSGIVDTRRTSSPSAGQTVDMTFSAQQGE